MGTRTVAPAPPPGFVEETTPAPPPGFSAAPPAPPPGFVEEQPDTPSLLSKIGTVATTSLAQQATEALGGQYQSQPERLGEGFSAVESLIQRAVDTVGGSGTTEAIKRNFPLIPATGNVGEEAVKALGGMAEFMTSPVGGLMPAAESAAAAAGITRFVRPLIGAALGADMTPGAGESIKQAWQDPNRETIPRALVQTMMAALPLVHAGATELDTLRRTRETKEARTQQADAATPPSDARAQQVATASDIDLAGNAESQDSALRAAANREIEARQRSGRWTLEDQQPERRNREARRAATNPPETPAPPPGYVEEAQSAPAPARPLAALTSAPAPMSVEQEIANHLKFGPVEKLEPWQRDVIDAELERRTVPEVNSQPAREEVIQPSVEPAGPAGASVSPGGEKPVASEPQPALSSERDVPDAQPEAVSAHPGGTQGERAQVLEPRRPSHPSRIGAPARVLVPGEERSFTGNYAVRELADVAASHNPFNFEPNPLYQHTNDRDYSNPQNAERIIRQAKTFEPDFLISDNIDATNGPPIIDANGNVLGGNSRTMTLGRVYAENPEAAARYRETLKAKAERFGINPADIDSMKEPVLVREISSTTPAQSAITDLNKTGTATLRPSERAIADARRIDEGTIEYLSQQLDAEGANATLAEVLGGKRGPDIINRLIDDNIITPQERPQYIDERGVLTPEGKHRIQRLMVGRLFRDSTQYENAPPELRNKLERAVSPLTRLQGRAEWDLTDTLREAVDALTEARTRDIKNLRDLTAQASMFGAGPKYSPEAIALAEKLKEGPLKVAAAFREYASDEMLTRPGQPATMFEPPSRTEAFENAFGKMEAPSALDRAAAEASARLKSAFKGETLSANPVGMIGDLAIIGAQKLVRGAEKYGTWAKEMVADFGERIRPQLLKVWTEAKRWIREHAPEQRQGSAARRATQRGSMPIGKPQPPEQPAVKPPGRRLVASPNLNESQDSFVANLDVSPETRAQVENAVGDYVATNTDTFKPYTFKDVQETAKAIDPKLLLDLSQKSWGKWEQLPAPIAHAMRRTINALGDNIAELSKLQTEMKGSGEPEAKLLEIDAKTDQLRKDQQTMLNALLPLRSQAGRALAYWRMQADSAGFDTEYWLNRARKAAGLPPGTTELPAGLRDKIVSITAKGRKAQAEAEAAPPPAAPEPPTPIRSTRFKVPLPTPTPEAPAPGQAPAAPGTTPAAKAPSKPRTAPAVDDAKRELAQTLATAEKSSKLDTAMSIWKAGLLTGFKTHARNVLGNTGFQLMEEASRAPSAAVDLALSLATGRRTVEGTSAANFTKAVRAAATTGMREAGEVIRHGATLEDLAKMDVRKELNSGNRFVDTYVNTVFRALSAEDRVFRRYAYERSLSEQLTLAKTDKPTTAIQAEALAYSEWATFNNKAPLAQAWSRGKSSLSPEGRAVADFVLPFVNTPANVFARLMDYTPVGTAARVAITARDIAKGGEFTAQQQRALSQAIGRGSIGTALILAGYYNGQRGTATGVASGDRTMRTVKEAAGQPAGAVKLGDSWHQISTLSPGGNLFILGASLGEEARHRYTREQLKNQMFGFVGIAGKTVLDQPMLKGLSALTDALEDPRRSMASYAAGEISSVIPTAVGDIATAVDPTRRDTRRDVAGRTLAKIPGAGATLPARTDIFGRRLEGRRSNALNPFLSQTDRADAIVRELLREQVPVATVKPKVNESEEATRLRGILTGREVYLSLGDVIDSPQYQSVPRGTTEGETRNLFLHHAITKGRQAINDQLTRAGYFGATPAEQVQILRDLIGKQ